ncbi:MAG: hypothetical protein U0166_17680 [Acidobacteriota bacterium]
MNDTPPDDWCVDWQEHEHRQILRSAALTVQERLAWLEDAILFAHRAGALPIPRDPWTGCRLSPTGARRVAFTGWRPGLRKVPFGNLLRRHLGLSLAEAKGVVDSVLHGERVLVATSSLDGARELLDQARQLGVIGDVDP